MVVVVLEADMLSVEAPGSADNSSAASSNSRDERQETQGVSNSRGATGGVRSKFNDLNDDRYKHW